MKNQKLFKLLAFALTVVVFAISMSACMKEEDYKYYEEEETTYHFVESRTKFEKGNIPVFVSEMLK